METSPRIVKYSLNYLTKATNDRKIKELIKSDINLAQLFGKQEESVVYTSKKATQATTSSYLHHDVHELSTQEFEGEEADDDDGDYDYICEDEDKDEDDNYSRELRRNFIDELASQDILMNLQKLWGIEAIIA